MHVFLYLALEASNLLWSTESVFYELEVDPRVKQQLWRCEVVKMQSIKIHVHHLTNALEFIEHQHIFDHGAIGRTMIPGFDSAYMRRTVENVRGY